jgi:glycosyltransferase involved in cell wall biosynthesis
MTKLSVVLCTFNEENCIKKTLEILMKEKIISEIIIIDDNSKDKTIKIIKKFKNKKIKLYIRKKIRGFASALIYGIKKTKNKNVLRFDVDMYRNIKYFINIFKKYTRKDCIIFSRYVPRGKDLRGKFRKFSSLILNLICKYLLSDKIKDYTSCTIIFDKKILNEIKIKNTSYANFIIEFCYDLILKKKNFIEVPFMQFKNTEKNSKSAPDLKTFLQNGLYYTSTIIKCLFKMK